MNNIEKTQLALEVAFESGNYYAWKWITTHPLAKPEHLDEIEKSIKGTNKEAIRFREYIAKNLATPEKTLVRIAAKSERSMLNVIQNKNCPNSVLKKAVIIINQEKSRSFNRFSSLEKELNKITNKISPEIKQKLNDYLTIQDILE